MDQNDNVEQEQQDLPDQKIESQTSNQPLSQLEQEPQKVQEQDTYQFVDIVVQDPQIQEGSFSKFTLYQIKGRDRAGNFEVQRRFNEFYSAREALLTRWPCCIIPRLPGKKMFSGNEKKVVEDRLKFLNAFCSKISKLPHLFYSTEFNQIFLRSKDADVSKVLSSIAKNSPQEIIQKYQFHFGQLQGKDIDQTLIESLDTFTTYVRKSLETLKKYKIFVKEVVENQEQLNIQLAQTIQTQLPDYEKQLLHQYVGGNEDALLFANPANIEAFSKKFHVQDIFKANNLQIFLDLIRLEIKDCKAFLQQIQVREEFDQKRIKLETKSRDLQIEYQNAVQGKSSLKSIFSKGSSEEYKSKIQLSKQDTQIEIENTKVLLDIITAILGFIEIDNFKKEKQSTYQNIMASICDLEIESIQQQMRFWEFVEQKSAKLLEQSA